MTDLDETQVLPAIGTSNGHAPTSVFDALRAKRAEHTAPQTYDIDVPGYDGCLVLRLGPVTGTAFTRLRERFERSRSPERDFILNADTLIAACREVLGRAKADDELQPLDEDDPMLLDERLSEQLGLGAKSARDIVRALFEAAPSPELAVGAVMGGYMQWATAVDSETDATFMGESVAAPR